MKFEKEYLPRWFINGLPEGFAYHKLVTDSHGRPVDYVFLDINKAFTTMTGLSRDAVIGKKVTEVLPDLQHFWITTYGRVAQNCSSNSFEQYSEPLERWYEVNAFSQKKHFFVTVFRDITERKQTAQALKASKKNLSIILNSIGDGVIATDTCGRITLMNPKAEELTGWSFSEAEQRLVEEVFQIADTHTNQPVLGPVQRVLHEGHTVGLTNHTTLITRNGSQRHIADSAAPIRDEGEMVGVIMVFSDVTEQYRSREALRKSEKRYRTLFETMTEGCQIIGFDWSYLYLNDAAAEHARKKKGELVGKTMMEVYAGIEETEMFSFFKKCMEIREPQEMETRFVYPDGEAKWFHLQMQPVPEGIFILSLDITERKLAEKKHRASELKYRSLIEQSGEMIVLHDLKGNILEVNRKVAVRHGYSQEALLRMTIFDLQNGTPHTVANDHQNIIQQWKEWNVGKSVRLEREHTCKDGTVFPVLIHTSKVAFGGNEYILTLVHDITDWKREEEKRIKLRKEYEQVFQSTQDAMFLVEVVDRNTFQYLRNNRAHEKATGFSLDLIRGKTPEELLGEEAGGRITANYRRSIEKGSSISYEETLDLPGGKRTWLTELTPVFEKREPSYIVGSSRDITERKKYEAQIRHMSFHDSATSLYNRSFVEEELKRLDTERQLPLSIITADINGLKLVNDTFGYDEGTRYLQKTAELLRQSCREEDIIARWGGDEFLIVLPQTTEETTQQICSIIQNTCAGAEGDNPVSIALGYAVKETTEQDTKEIIQKAEEWMYKNKLTEHRSSKGALLTTLLKTLGAKSHETEEHAFRLQRLAFAIGNEIELSSTDLDRLSLLVTLHDIGKASISEDILKKSGRLSPEEWKLIKKHPERGYRIASATEEFSHVAEGILYHHEHWDGKGYPEGLKGKEIPLLSRITAVVDAFDAMTHHRPYNLNPLSPKEAVEELQHCAGTQFDPDIVEVFVRLFDKGLLNDNTGDRNRL